MSILENLSFSLNATMPIFFVMVIGWWFKKANILDGPTTAKLNQLVFKFFLPALMFVDLATEDLGCWGSLSRTCHKLQRVALQAISNPNSCELYKS